MGLLNSYYQGNRSELLADYILSGIGISTPVRRQFDEGFDFYCNLADRASSYLTFGFPFVIQIKSESVAQIEYGTTEPGKWQFEKISHLYRNEIPFFVGFVDKDEKSLAIHDTTGLWQLYVNNTLNVSHIKLSPNERAGWRANISTEQIEGWTNSAADGLTHTIDLGNPIIKLNITDFDKNNEGLLFQKIAILRTIISIEQRNLNYRNLSVKSFKEIKTNKTNEEKIEYGTGYRTEPDPQRIGDIYESIKEPLIFLYINLASHDRKDESEAVKSLLKLMPMPRDLGIYEQLFNGNNLLFDWAGELLFKSDPEKYREIGEKLRISQNIK